MGGGSIQRRVRVRALERGLIAAGTSPSVEEFHALIFEPGFSTAEKVTEISGRGVGIDVVCRNIDALRGRIEISTAAGKGTTFVIRLPLTRAVLDGVIVGAGRERFVMPTTTVRESLRPLESHVHMQGMPRLVQVRDSLLPLVSLVSRTVRLRRHGNGPPDGLPPLDACRRHRRETTVAKQIPAMALSAQMERSMIPQPGDVLVSRSIARIEHDLSIVPDAPHLTCDTHDHAIAAASELAERLHVDAWLTEDHLHFMRIGSHRKS